MTDLNEILQQAKQMQERMKEAQEKAMVQEVEGESGAGMVRVTMNGRHDVKKVALAEGLLTEDKNVVEDLIAAAVNDAVRKIDERNRDSLSGLTAGMKLPEGFKFPF